MREEEVSFIHVFQNFSFTLQTDQPAFFTIVSKKIMRKLCFGLYFNDTTKIGDVAPLKQIKQIK